MGFVDPIDTRNPGVMHVNRGLRLADFFGRENESFRYTIFTEFECQGFQALTPSVGRAPRDLQILEYRYLSVI
jgi:hypothetical protein